MDRAALRVALLLSSLVPAAAIAGLWLATVPHHAEEGESARVWVATVIAAAGVGFLLVRGRHLRRATMQSLDHLETTANEMALTARHNEELAEVRENSRKVLLHLARRTQILIHRQIAMLDTMERKHEDPDLLEELFAVDHLSTRMRRHAENLVILGGDLPARQWRSGVALTSILRSAVSETEEYTRVKIGTVPRTTVAGRAVADVVHLIAELLENGTSFSPPHTQVHLTAHEVANGLVVEVEDRGLGMPEEEMLRLNALLSDTSDSPGGPVGDDPRLGAHVVARLARRHGIGVSLRRSPYGGTLAIVLLPQALLEQPRADTGRTTAGRPAAAPAPAPSAPASAGAHAAGPGEQPSHVRPSQPPAAAGGRAAAGTAPATPAVPHGQSSSPWEAQQAPAPRNPEAAHPGRGPQDARNTQAAQEAQAAQNTQAAQNAQGFYEAYAAPVPPSAPASGGAYPARPAPDGPADEPVTPEVLPKRVKQASLAVQLRQAAEAEAWAGRGTNDERPGRGAQPAPELSPEASRARMAAIQAATRRARDADAGGGDATPNPPHAQKDQP
ncbi:sensor histidine kinase [Streptomyces sp. HB2AG]|uniref:sensor histidine kinase n=1 Tax=Streptomyces sp. HB2AG TaxID=2983400 RepID=UPI0022AB3083|nr:ATP-binding protein [Streptomyces sp. HB2AG]MCZ2523337.1 ATP-binding protein [Streptomyces sp. HB2AG]